MNLPTRKAGMMASVLMRDMPAAVNRGVDGSGNTV